MPPLKAILEAALPLQRFLDLIYTHIISRVRKAGRDVFDCFRDRAQIAHAVIDDGDVSHK